MAHQKCSKDGKTKEQIKKCDTIPSEYVRSYLGVVFSQNKCKNKMSNHNRKYDATVILTPQCPNNVMINKPPYIFCKL